MLLRAVQLAQEPPVAAAGTRQPSAWPHAVITAHGARTRSARVKTTHNTKTVEKRSKPSSNAVKRWGVLLYTKKYWREPELLQGNGPEVQSQRIARCQARSKRSGEQCRKTACRGKSVCRTHGGTSTGPKTDAGKARCAEAKTVHGRERRTMRVLRAAKLKELRPLEGLMLGFGMIR